MHIDDHFWGSPFQDLKMIDIDLARGQFHFLPGARHIISFSSLDLHRRINRRGLFDLSNVTL